MPFIKHGDGKIVTVLDEEETEEQKKTAKEVMSKIVKQTQSTDDLKKSGR